MKILITGGSGVIGLNLISEFLKSNENSYQIFTQHQREIPNELLEEIDGNSRVIHFRSLADIGSNLKFDLIVNASGVSQPNLFTVNTKELIRSNINQTLDLFTFLELDGTFIHMSTSEIYSGCEHRPCTEDHRGEIKANNPRRIYMMAKEISELALSTCLTSNQRVIVLRISLVYGKYYIPPDERVMYSFIEQSIEGAIKPRGGLNNIRRYLHVRDLFQYIKVLVDELPTGFHIFNIGGSEKVTIGELANLVAKISKSKLVIEPGLESQKGAPGEVWVDTSKLQKIAVREPSIELEVGLTEVIEWRASLDF